MEKVNAKELQVCLAKLCDGLIKLSSLIGAEHGYGSDNYVSRTFEAAKHSADKVLLPPPQPNPNPNKQMHSNTQEE